MPGGTRSYELARRFVEAGHQVQIVTSDCAPAEGRTDWYETSHEGFTVHWLPNRYDNKMSYAARIRAFFRFALKAKQKAASLPADLIFATSTPLTIAIPAVRAARKLKIPMVFEVRDLWPEVPIQVGAIRNPMLKFAARRLEQYAYRNAKRIVTLAPGMKDGVVATGYPEDHVAMVPNGSNTEVFRPDANIGRALRDENPWLADRRMIVYTGALGLVNGVEWLAHLSAEVTRRDPSIAFVVIGDGREGEAIRKIATEAGTLDRSFYMIGKRPKEDIPRWLAAADLIAVCCTGPEIVRRDSSFNKFFDAMASGTPIAHPFHGWLVDLADQNDAGFYLDEHDLPAAADRLIEQLADREWLDQAGKNARRLAEIQFSWDILAPQVEQVLLDALSD